MDPVANACPTCGTVRGKYDRFCTGCGRDLGAPGAALGPMIRGPQAGVSRPGSAGPSTLSAPRPGPATPRYAATRALGAPVAPDLRSYAQINPSTYRADGGQRFWRTVAIANRVVALVWVGFFGLGVVLALTKGGGPDTSAGAYLFAFVFAGLLPAAVLWWTADGLEAGSPLLRLAAYVELAILVVVTLGLILVPLILIYVFAGDRPSAAGT
ncbi:MAG TPA: hypothetical protein VF323_11530 [Candidatus Limnocylindrales bacterium]